MGMMSRTGKNSITKYSLLNINKNKKK